MTPVRSTSRQAVRLLLHPLLAPAEGTMPSNSGAAPGPSAFTSTSGSPTKRETGYFGCRPNQQQWQAFPHSRPQTRSSGDGMNILTNRSSNLSSSPSTISSYSMPATSCIGGVQSISPEDQRTNSYMNLDDPPPASLKRSLPPAYSSSFRSHPHSHSHNIPGRYQAVI